MIPMELISYKFELFEGPLELLLSLVEKNRMKIDDIPIDELCSQYFDYMSEAEKYNIELACEFLFTASELMLIKSRMLLPRSSDTADDPRTPLVNSLIEYKKAKLAASQLTDMFSEFGSRMIKEQDDISSDKSYVAPHDVILLFATMKRLLAEVGNESTEEMKKEFDEIISAPRIPMKTVVGELLEKLRGGTELYLDEYFTCFDSKSLIIVKFMGILELIKSHIVALCEDASDTDGVTDITSHIRLVLIAGDDSIASSISDWGED